MKNLLTDIAGVRVGHADDATLASGVTAIIFDKPAVASIDVRGGAPGTRESALLDPVATVDAIDGSISLTATQELRVKCSANQTEPMPPLPSCLSSR